MKTQTVSSFCFSFFVMATLSLFSCSFLQAGGFGKHDQVTEYEGSLWNEVYFDMNHLYFEASIPNYSGTTLTNGKVFFKGLVADYSYLIETTFNAGFNPPSSQSDFSKLIQDANPDFLVVEVYSDKLGANYAVDLIPVTPGFNVFWRFLSTNDRLIKMGTDDIQENRRQKFFDSIHINR